MIEHEKHESCVMTVAFDLTFHLERKREEKERGRKRERKRDAC